MYLLIALYDPLKDTKGVSPYCAVFCTQGHCVSLLRCMLYSGTLNVYLLIALYDPLKDTKVVSPYCAVCCTQGH